MSDHSLRRLIALVATSLVVVVALGSVAGARSVAGDLTDRSDRALTAAGLDDVRVDFRGREAELRGGNDVEARLAGTLVRALPGVRRVEVDRARDRVVAGASRFELDRFGDDVEISGTVPTPDDAAAIKVAVASALQTTVTGDVTVTPSARSASWVTALPDVFAIVARVDRLSLEISGDGTVQLGGDVEAAQVHERLVRRVAAALPDLDVVDTIRVDTTSGRGR